MENAFTSTDGLSPKLKKLLAAWQTKCVDGHLPSRDDFTPRSLKSWLGNLALLEHVSENGYRFRICGTNLINRFGCDVTNKTLRDLNEEFRYDLRSRLDRALMLRTPVSTRLRIPFKQDIVDYSELILPLANDKRKVGMLLLASYPILSAPADLR